MATGVTNIDFVGSLSNGLPTIDPNHEGHNGWPTDLMSTYINGWMSTFTPDTVLLLAGANDLIQGAGPSTAISRLGTLLNQIHTARPATRIIVGTWWFPRSGSDNPKFKPVEILLITLALSLVSARAALGWNIQVVDTAIPYR